MAQAYFNSQIITYLVKSGQSQGSSLWKELFTLKCTYRGPSERIWTRLLCLFLLQVLVRKAY